jgi:hypothetical protein
MQWLVVALFGVFILMVDAAVLGIGIGVWLGTKFDKWVEGITTVAGGVMLATFIALEWLILTRF